MRSARRRAAGALAALTLAALAAGVPAAPALAQSAAPQALSPWDAQLYASAFAAVRRGDFAEAERAAARVGDKSLMGFVEFQKLFHPTAYKATYEELVSWLERYGDLPMAQRVFALAVRRKPEDAPEPRLPGVATARRDWAEAAAAPTAPPGDVLAPSANEGQALGPRAAREALNAGDLQTAHRLGVETGDHWVAGLAAWRMQRWDEAFRRFETVAADPAEDPWVRSGGAWWAARAALATGRTDKAVDFLQIAAQYPYTFYGIIAERQLGLEAVVRTGPQPFAGPELVKTAATPQVDAAALRRFLDSEPRARRAAALAQVGQTADAAQELRAGLRDAGADEAKRAEWARLGLALSPLLTTGQADGVDGRAYPTPEFEPRGGFTLDKALVYAVTRRESKFDPAAKSYAGAHGLMQVMPSTAAWLYGDDGFTKKPDRLLDPAVNLRAGQDYFKYLMSQPAVNNDILRAVAAYNAGPGPVIRTRQTLGDEADALLFLESIPVGQTRVYVKEVMAAYWIYRRLFGQDTPSLDAVIAGAVQIRADADIPARTASEFRAALQK